MKILTILFVICTVLCVSDVHLRPLSEEFDLANFTSIMCGSYKTECKNKKEEIHIYKGKYAAYPTEFTQQYNYYTADTCESSSIGFSILSKGPITSASTVKENTILVKIKFDTNEVTFMKDPKAQGVECDKEVTLNQVYKHSDLICTMNGKNIFDTVPKVGDETSKQVFMDITLLQYEDGTEMKSKDPNEQCDNVMPDNGLGNVLLISFIVLLVVAIVGVILIMLFCAKGKKPTKSKKELPAN